MTNSQRLELRASEIRQRLNEVAGMTELSDEVQAESDALTTEYASVETRKRAALVAESEEAVEVHATPDAEDRERVRLRDRCSLGGYILARLQGRLPAAEHAEYMSACGVENGIPIDLFESDRPVETHADAPTPAPAAGSGAALNIGGILPHIFDQTIARLLGIAMPVVGTGTHSELVVTTPPGTAAAKTKGSAIESTAGALTPVNTNPRRISARLSLQAEDIAQIGTPRFEAAMRAALTGSLSDGYDKACLTGTGVAPDVLGLMPQLDTPTPPTTVAAFDSMLTAAAAFCASKYAETLRAVSIIVPSDVYRLSRYIVPRCRRESPRLRLRTAVPVRGARRMEHSNAAPGRTVQRRRGERIDRHRTAHRARYAGRGSPPDVEQHRNRRHIHRQRIGDAPRVTTRPSR